MYLDELTTTEFKERIDSKTMVIWPIGAVEEHGPHLPLSTDSLQPEHIAERVAERTGALIAPPLRYGYLRQTAPFPGSISLRWDTLRSIALDILMGLAKNDVRYIVVLSGHAGRDHMSALRLAALDVVDSHDVRIWVMSDYDIAYAHMDELASQDDGHAGTIETSRIMNIRPDLVKERPGPFQPDWPRFEMLAEPREYFPDGYHGDPSAADVEKARRIDDIIVEEMVRFITEAVDRGAGE